MSFFPVYIPPTFGKLYILPIYSYIRCGALDERKFDRPIVIMDDNGVALGSVCRQDDKLFMLNVRGQVLQEVSAKLTIKNVKTLLLNLKFQGVV